MDASVETIILHHTAGNDVSLPGLDLKNDMIAYIYCLFCLLMPNPYHQLAGNEQFPAHFSIPITPQLTNYNKAQYGADNKNWDISIGENGAVYFANSAGLLRYDGENWQSYPTPNMLHAVHYQNDTIYVGGNQFMGYFLADHLEDGFHLIRTIQESIWKIFEAGQQVVFQAFNRFYFLNHSGALGYERLPGNITFSYPINNDIYYQIVYNDLFELKTNGLKQRIKIPDLHHYRVKSIIKQTDHTLLIGTLRAGLFIYDGENLKPLNNGLNSLLKRAGINKIKRIDDQLYAFGTMNAGLIVAELNGNIRYHLSTKTGLQNNRIHSIEYQQGKLWLGLDDGISLINLQSPSTFINDLMEHFGAINDICQQGQDYYIATNQGIYHGQKIFTDDFPRFTLLKGSDGLVWNISEVDSLLWCGHNDGTYVIENQRLKKIAKTAGGFEFQRSQIMPDIIYESSYYGIAIFRKVAGQWQYWATVDEQLQERTKNIVEQADGSLLVTTFSDRIVQLWLDHTYKKVVKAIDFKATYQLGATKNVRAVALNGQTIITSQQQSVTFANGKISATAPPLNDLQYISQPVQQYSMVSIKDQLYLYHAGRKELRLLPQHYNQLAQPLVYKFAHVSTLADSLFALPTDHGMAFWNLNKPQMDSAHRPISFTSVTVHDHRKGTAKRIKQQHPTLAHQDNSIEFSFTAYRYGEATDYEYQLKGYNNQWQTNGLSNHLEFQNLPHGDYTLMVRIRGEKQAAAYHFTIESPWYLSTAAYLAYVLLLIGLLFLGYKYHRGRLRLQRKNMLRRERQTMHKTRRQHEKKMQQLKEEQLQKEINNKNGELSKLLIQDGKKKEIIANLQQQIQQLREHKKPLRIRDIERLDGIIQEQFDEKKDWLVFESAFSQTHQDFFKRLQEKHEKLTTEDLKLCAYLKVNLSTKELAPIFNITPKSVELRRYRLKKKLGLNKEINLKDYIKSI